MFLYMLRWLEYIKVMDVDNIQCRQRLFVVHDKGKRVIFLEFLRCCDLLNREVNFLVHVILLDYVVYPTHLFLMSVLLDHFVI